MQSYKILSIRWNELNTGINYTLDERTGNFVTNSHSVEESHRTKSLMDFFSLNGVNITKVRRNPTTTAIRQCDFSIGDRITRTNGVGHSATIVGIKIEGGRVVLVTNVTNLGMSLEDAQLYVPPVQDTVPSNNTSTNAITSSTAISDMQDRVLREFDGGSGRTIRLERLLKNRRTQTPEQFLIKFFKEWNYAISNTDTRRNSIYVDDSSRQTDCGRRRSLGDIFMLMRYYYPTITLREVLVLLYRTLPRQIERGFRSSICNQIHKRVWYYDPANANDMVNSTSADEYGHALSWYTDRI
jgi:hypothetical protein